MSLENLEPVCISPNSFEVEKHYYPKVLNAQINPLIRHFIHMSNDRIAQRYSHLNPHVSPSDILEILGKPCKNMPWAGCDLMHVTNAYGNRKMVVIETNSSPSGQKSMPIYNEEDESNGYGKMIRGVVQQRAKNKSKGILAVLYDKNPMEASGYAACMADEFHENVWLIPYENDNPSHVKIVDQQLHLVQGQELLPIRFAYRYVTQKPWNRLPVQCKTNLVNPIIACLAGGRNKALAAKAYDLFNAKIHATGLQIQVPQTYWDVHFEEIPLWLERLGGYGVIKVPYSNAGQGVYTITSDEEFEHFKNTERRDYDRYIVQSLIGHYNWSSGLSDTDKLFHVGTIPNKFGKIYVADLRMMVSFWNGQWHPVAMYARRAPNPISGECPKDSWSVLGTNLSGKDKNGHWITDSNRLLLMDERDFNKLGLSLDEIIEAYVQTIMSVHAINDMANTLLGSKRTLKRRLFSSLVNDQSLCKEILL